MLKYAQEEYGFRLSLKNVVLPKVERKQVEKISDTEQKKLVSYLKANMSLTAFGILLSLFMGLRIGELCGLKWEDVDFRNKILHIRRTVQRISSANGNRKTKIVISAPKSATSFREIAIPDMLMKCSVMKPIISSYRGRTSPLSLALCSTVIRRYSVPPMWKIIIITSYAIPLRPIPQRRDSTSKPCPPSSVTAALP